MSTPIPFSILTANLKDLPALRELERICFGADAWPLLDLISVLTMPGIVRLKSVVNGKMTGFVGGDFHRNDGMGWITTICVMPQYQHQGMGSALLAACERQMGQPVVRLSVRISNLGAIHLYQQKGYRQVDIWRQYYMDHEDALVLENTSRLKHRVIVG